MKQKLVISLILLFSLHLNAQQMNNKISLEFGYGLHSYSMNKLNEFYIDSFAIKPSIDIFQNHIKKGNQYHISFVYQPNPYFDIGFYGSYQYGNSKSKPKLTEVDDYGFTIKEHCGISELRTEAIAVGINATWYIDGLLKWNERESILNRFHFGLELNGGIGFSKVIADFRYPTLPIASSYNFFTSKDFQGQLGVKAEYDFTKSPIFTTLGIRLGYQFYKTQNVKDRFGENWEVDGKYPINLDFSGFYFGTYLKIGK